MDHMDMSTTTGAMPSSTSMSGMGDMDMGMDGMDMSQGGMMSMSSMMMTFFTGTTTPLYSESWMPSTTGQYAGTCIFLIALAAIFRGIIAVRANFPVLLETWVRRRDTTLLRSEFGEVDGIKLRLSGGTGRPWNINEALARAVLDTVLAGVSYLLMLAVMTMNVGYFMSILGGTFLGSFVLGDWTANTAEHCDAH